jgi:hypothetical protein
MVLAHCVQVEAVQAWQPAP